MSLLTAGSFALSIILTVGPLLKARTRIRHLPVLQPAATGTPAEFAEHHVIVAAGVSLSDDLRQAASAHLA